MNEETRIFEKTKHKAAYYFWPGISGWAVTLLYAGLLYGMNVKNCRYAWTQDGCFMEQKYGFFEFLKVSMGPNTLFISLTILSWLAALTILVGAVLFFAFRNNEITVSNRRIYGTAAFGTQVQLPLTSVIHGEEGPGHSVKLHLLTGSLLFGGIKNRKEVLRILNESLVLREKQRVQIGSRGLSGRKLAVLCFLPFVLLFLPILLWGEPSPGKAWELYLGWDEMQKKAGFLSFWLMEQMEMQNNWPICLIYFAFPALLAGGVCFCAWSRQKVLVTDCRVQGRGSFRAAFDLPLAEIRAVQPGWFHSVILHHAHGKIRIHGLKNREEVLGALKAAGKQEEASGSSAEAVLKSRTLSDKTLGIFCFLPGLIFSILLAVGIYRNAGFCREMYECFESVRLAHSFPEYLLMWSLTGSLGRWIKGFFWVSLAGVYGFFAYRSNELTLNKGRIQGKSKWGGCLDTEEAFLEGISMGPFGSLTLYTDAGKFVFGNIKNRRDFYDYFTSRFSE